MLTDRFAKYTPKRIHRMLFSLAALFTAAPVFSQALSERPRLVLFVTVDQLRSDYLRTLQSAFGEKGFKRLLREGVVYENLTYGFPDVDRSSAVATLFAGATPWYTGIVSNTCYNPGTRRVEAILNAPGVLGNYTSLTLSPQALLTSTVSDELKIATDGRSDVYAVAPEPEQALLSAGHAANAAFWLDNSNGKWATTTYYKDIPWYVEQYNIGRSLSGRIDTLNWVPMREAGRYNLLQRLMTKFAFRHTFSRFGAEKFRYFKSSGLVNEEVTRVASLFFDPGTLGQRNETDLLSVGYSAGVYQEKNIQAFGMEIEDTYLRLDRTLGELLDLVDKKVGLKNCLVVLASTGYFDGDGKEAGLFQVPAGEFYPNRAVSLLNMYLMAVYGDGNWVEGYHDRQLFLNRKLIADKLIDPEEIETRAARFLVQMTGVQDVTTAHQLLHGNWNERIGAARDGYHRKRSGDLLLEIQPGWEIVYEDAAQTREYVRLNAIPAPLVLMGKGLNPTHEARPVRAVEVAPTVSRILRIRAPNAAGAAPLPAVQ